MYILFYFLPVYGFYHSILMKKGKPMIKRWNRNRNWYNTISENIIETIRMDPRLAREVVVKVHLKIFISYFYKIPTSINKYMVPGKYFYIWIDILFELSIPVLRENSNKQTLKAAYFLRILYEFSRSIMVDFLYKLRSFSRNYPWTFVIFPPVVLSMMSFECIRPILGHPNTIFRNGLNISCKS